MLPTAPYVEQAARWPDSGRHILAHFDATSIVVYQAFNPAIAAYAVASGRFDGGGFSLSRMSWIKTNFLWMMYRSGWATKPQQERVLAVSIPRPLFDGFLASSVASAPAPSEEIGSWRTALQGSDVRLQWDPDHDPSGQPSVRRAIQVGLRGQALVDYALGSLRILDITEFVVAQRPAAQSGALALLQTPVERPYFPADPRACTRIGLDVA